MIQQSPILCREDYPDEQLEFVKQLNTNNSPPEQIVMRSQEADDEKLKLDNSSNYTKNMSKPASIVQYFHIRHFAKRLMKYKRYLSMFTKDHYEAINDMASSLDLETIKQHGSNLKPLISTAMIKQSAIYTSFLRMANTYYKIQDKVIAKLPLVDPDSQIKLYWDCLLLIPRIYFTIIIPMDLAWIMNQFLYDTFIIPTVLSLLLLIMDTFFRLCQSFYMNGQLITSRFQIFLHVLTRAAGIEITSLIIQITFFIQAYYYNDQINVNKDLHYLLLLLTFRQALEDTLNLSKVALSIIELLKLLFLVCYVIHLFACIWFWVGQYSDLYLGQCWINNANRNLTDMGFGQQYLYSFYFSTVTMFTVGYGDITPQSYPEILVSIIFMMICSIQLSYSVNTIGGIIERISASKQEKMKAFHVINQYMQKNKISYLLQYQIRDYINYYITESQNQATEEENTIIDMLSTNLKNKLITEANSAMIKSVPLFEDFSHQFIQAILTSIRSITLPPESIVDFAKLVNHKSNNFCICQISSGKIISYVENSNSKQELSVLGTLNQGEYFGLTQFILNKQQQQRFKTQGFTKLLFLARRDFIRVLADYPEDYEKFRLMVDNIEQDIRCSPEICLQCQSRSHQSVNCHMTHFKPDNEFLIKSFQINQVQTRNTTFKRKLDRRINIQDLYNQKDIELLSQTIQNQFWKEVFMFEDKNETIFIKSDVTHAQQPKRTKVNTELHSNKDRKSTVLIQNIKQQRQSRIKFNKICNVIRISYYWSKISKQKKYILPFKKENFITQLQNTLKNNIHMSSSIQNDAELLLMQLQNQCKQHYEDEQFDIMNNYNFYRGTENASAYIKSANQRNVSQVKQRVYNKIVKFMFYPQLYIERYLPISLDHIIDDHIMEQQQIINANAVVDKTVYKLTKQGSLQKRIRRLII